MKPKKLGLYIATGTLIAVPVAPAEDWGKDIQYAECPPEVSAVIERQGGHVDDIELGTTDGQQVYRVEIERPGPRDLEMFVRADGTVLRTIAETPWSDIPPAVIKSVEALLSDGGKIETDDATSEKSPDGTVYVIEIERSGIPGLHVTLAETGEILKTVEEVDD